MVQNALIKCSDYQISNTSNDIHLEDCYDGSAMAENYFEKNLSWIELKNLHRFLGTFPMTFV